MLRCLKRSAREGAGGLWKTSKPLLQRKISEDPNTSSLD